MEQVVQEVVIPNDVTVNSWHNRIHYPYETKQAYKYTIVVAGVVCGCGLGQMYGIATYAENLRIEPELIKILEDIKTASKSRGIGAIIATLGNNYKHYHEDLLKIGFEHLSEYANYQHGQSGNYRQKLYVLKT
jgi:hypothetical protein